jgi:hypothetical protein
MVSILRFVYYDMHTNKKRNYQTPTPLTSTSKLWLIEMFFLTVYIKIVAKGTSTPKNL